MKFIDFKKYAIGFVLWLSFVWWYAFASTWSIWDLFIKSGSNWTLKDNTIWNNQIDNSQSFTVNWLTSNSTITASTFLYSSDERYKDNIKKIENSLEKVLSLNWVEWTWKKDDKKDIWFIAQEVEKVIPEIVNTDLNWYKSVQYWNISSLLVESIKEQQQIISKLEKRIIELENNK